MTKKKKIINSILSQYNSRAHSNTPKKKKKGKILISEKGKVECGAIMQILNEYKNNIVCYSCVCKNQRKWKDT